MSRSCYLATLNSQTLYNKILGSARATCGIYFICDLSYYFLYDPVVCVLDLHLQEIVMIMIFVFLKN